MPTITTKFTFFDNNWQEYTCILYITEDKEWITIVGENREVEIHLELKQFEKLHAGLIAFHKLLNDKLIVARNTLEQFVI